MAGTCRADSVYINLPVADVESARTFFEGLGFEADPRFSAERRAACIMLSETVSAMLLDRETFGALAGKPVANAATMSAATTCLRMQSREAVDGIMEAALAGGGTEPRSPRAQAAMYSRAFEDPDGHLWELLWVESG